MNPRFLKYAEWIVAVAISALVLSILFVRVRHGGGLWRDECDSLALARLPTCGELLRNLKFTSFPILFPAIVRAFTALFGTSDIALRSFSFLVGAALVAIAWFNARRVYRDVPLLLPTLAGLSTTFLIDGTWIRGYGVGSVLLVFAFGLTALFIARPTVGRLVAMFLASICAMHCLYFSAALVPALLLAAFGVCVLRKETKWALALCVVAAICALSYIPQFIIFGEIHDWVRLLQRQTSLIEWWNEFVTVCGEPAPWLAVMWVALLGLSILAALWRSAAQWRTEPQKSSVTFFGAVAALLAIPMYFIFLFSLRNIPEPRYYVALICLLATGAEFTIAGLSKFTFVRVIRLFVGIALATLLPFSIWPRITERETTLDLTARNLQRYARADDLIVVSPWFLSPGFSWYFHGNTPWMTLPELSEKRIHRYDLIKAKMIEPDPLADVQSAIARTLQSGNRVWIVGGAQPSDKSGPLSLTVAPDPKFGWSSQAYTYAWSTQLGAFLQQHVVDGEVVLPPQPGVSVNENIPLVIARGWRD